MQLSSSSTLRNTAVSPVAGAPAFASAKGIDAGIFLQVLGAWLWLPQAALLAWAVQQLAQGAGAAVMLRSAAGLLLLGLLRSGCEAWGLRRVFLTARAQLTALRAEVAVALAQRSPLDSARPASGLAASVMAEQAEAVVPWLVRYQPARWRVMLVLPVIAITVTTLSWVAALVLVLAAPLIPLFMALVGWRAKAASEAHMLELGGLNAFLLDRLRGLSTLRALGAVDATALRLRDAAQALRQRTMAVLRIAFLSSAVLELFAALGVAMVAVYIGFHLLGTLEFGAWGRRLSLGEGLFVLLLAPAFFEPLRDLSAAWHDRAAGKAALEALVQLGRVGQALPGALGATLAEDSVPSGALSVALHGVHFAHAGGGTAVVQDYNLHVAAGMHVALVGPSGSGKTTLLSLIAGLVAPDQGTVAIGGVPLTAATASTLRQRMAWMGQRPHVFAGTVQSNVSLGRAGVARPQVEAAMQWAALGDVAQAHPGSTLGEGGSGLSGGEAVRLALARVAAHTQAGLLLVDEPTAHLDSQTAQRVTDALLQLAVGKTLIVATHDPVLAARLGHVVQVGEPVAEELACAR
ncbi:ATP-binding cassette subfamily C protein CydD [Polaromonas sp. CG_9.5]|uniref:thiol reductant ABC exporter subunit CydD n=1 Tax=Polaromonas sp. CG_9.5 TaxID=3071705 RepID=UPI002E09590D|nr:ATP-binding cassette subfamily C protein CydD [Polaromonas sp. CG_9.5]